MAWWISAALCQIPCKCFQPAILNSKREISEKEKLLCAYCLQECNVLEATADEVYNWPSQTVILFAYHTLNGECLFQMHDWFLLTVSFFPSSEAYILHYMLGSSELNSLSIPSHLEKLGRGGISCRIWYPRCHITYVGIQGAEWCTITPGVDDFFSACFL